jgi:hypothetical protein
MQELVMKCDVCLEMLEEYLDGELTDRESKEIAAHLVTCSVCATERAALGAEQELFSRYDRELDVPASLWEQIAERTLAPVVIPVSKNGFSAHFAALFRASAFRVSMATAAALIVIALLIGLPYMRSRKQLNQQIVATTSNAPSDKKESPVSKVTNKPGRDHSAVDRKAPLRRPTRMKRTPIDQSDVLSSDFGYQDMDDQDTAKHIEQTQNLLRSIRNVQVGDGDQEIDVSYDKALSRRLLNENIVLRRDAEMKAKFPTKVLLSDLEPFLIDIANLPDQAKPDDVRAIKERVQKTEIVAALIGYE